MAERLAASDLRVTPQAKLLLGTLELADRNNALALQYLLDAEQAEPRLPGLHIRIGQVYLRTRRNADAERAFRKALEIDGDNASAHEGLAAALARGGRHEDAVDHALIAVGLMHNMPRAHLRLGVTLYQLGLFKRSVQAFETTLKLAPQTALAHRWLARIYRRHLPDAEKTLHHRLQANQIVRCRRERRSVMGRR